MCESRFCSAARKKSPPGRVRAPAPTWLGKSPRRFAKNAKGWAPGQKADSSPLKRIRNDKYLKAGSRRGAPRNDKCVKVPSAARKKSPPGRVRAPAPTWLGKSPHAFAKSAKALGNPAKVAPLSRRPIGGRDARQTGGRMPALRGPRRPAPRKSPSSRQITALAVYPMACLCGGAGWLR